MAHLIPLFKLFDRGIQLQPDEAVALVLQVLDHLRTRPDESELTSPVGPPALETVLLGPDGAVLWRGTAATPTVSEIGWLLDALVTAACRAPMPGALRYTIARARLDVDAPPFHSLEEFSTALRRFEKRERGVVLRALYDRASSQMKAVILTLVPATTAPTPRPDRRRNMPSASDLRRELREADRRLYETLVAQASRERLGLSRARFVHAVARWTVGATSVATLALALFLLAMYPGTKPTGDGGGTVVQSARGPSATDRAEAPAQAREPDAALPVAVPAAGLTPMLTRGVMGPAYSPSFASDGAALFFHTGRSADARSALMSEALRAGDSAAVPILDDGARNYHVQPSPDGTRIAFDSDRHGDRGVYIADRDGANRQRVVLSGYAAVPTWAPDSERLTFVRAEDTDPRIWNLWMLSLKSGEVRRLTNVRFGQTWGASWFPDARRIGYSHEDRFFVLDVDSGRSREYQSPVPGRLVRTPAVSPDGSHVIFQVRRSGAWLLNLATGSAQRVLSDRSAEEFAWSPDGRRVAFHSRRAGEWGIWILAL